MAFNRLATFRRLALHLALSLGNVSALSYRLVTGECYVSLCADMHLGIDREWISYILCMCICTQKTFFKSAITTLLKFFLFVFD